MTSYGNIEVDLIEMSVGCAEQCSHCSESPETGLRNAVVRDLLEAVSALVEIERGEGIELFGNYWFPFPASDPFAYPDLFTLCQGVWERRAIPVYLLSLGWNRHRGAENARWLAERPDSLFRITITVSNFSRLAVLNPAKHRSRLAESLRDLRPIWSRTGPDGKPLVLLSPQFVDSAPAHHPYSLEQTRVLLEDMCSLVGLSLDCWRSEQRIFERPVTGLGRAITELSVTSQTVLPITAEIPWPPLSRYPERPYSGLITLDGRLAVLRAPRGLLGRERGAWIQVSSLEAAVALDKPDTALLTIV